MELGGRGVGGFQSAEAANAKTEEGSLRLSKRASGEEVEAEADIQRS